MPQKMEDDTKLTYRWNCNDELDLFAGPKPLKIEFDRVVIIQQGKESCSNKAGHRFSQHFYLVIIICLTVVFRFFRAKDRWLPGSQNPAFLFICTALAFGLTFCSDFGPFGPTDSWARFSLGIATT